MKKVFGIILLAISILNIVAIIDRTANGESVGSPIYLILIVMMLFGGIGLLASKKAKDSSDLPVERKDD
jgi:hypothetical protein